MASRGPRTFAVKLSDRAIAALDLLPINLNRDALIFPGERGGKWMDRAAFLRGPWRKALSDAGLAHRDVNSLRDTAATIALNKGLQPAWIAQQFGNSPEVLLKHYARFLKTGDERNLALLNAPDVSDSGNKAATSESGV